MPDAAVDGAGGAGMMLNRRRSKARRRKRKELFGFQVCFAGFLLGLVAGLRSASQKAGEMISFRLCVKLNGFHDTCAARVYENLCVKTWMKCGTSDGMRLVDAAKPVKRDMNVPHM